jgi:hypothetical protein
MDVWPLEIHDLAAGKLRAGRDKDFEFLQFLSSWTVRFFHLHGRMELLRTNPSAPAVPERLEKLAHRLRERHRDDLARKPTGL